MCFFRKQEKSISTSETGAGNIMTKREQQARQTHRNGVNCAQSVYLAFSDKVTGTAPAPRSDGGKCGAVLSAEKMMQQMGLNQEEFDDWFLKTYGSLKCGELRKAKYPCNDLVGAAAGFVEEKLEEQ